MISCKPAPEAPVNQAAGEPSQTATARPPAIASKFDASATMEASAIPTNLGATPTHPSLPLPAKSFTPASSSTQWDFQLCSPLAWETIPTLFEIVSDPYRPPPANRPEERHHGVDFSHYKRKGNVSIEGEPIRSILNGHIASVINDRLPYGNMLIVDTPGRELPVELARMLGIGEGQSLYILYAHMASPSGFLIGDQVTCGQEIGAVGKTGYNIVNPHLHIESRLGESGSIFPVMAFYTTTASIEEMETYTQWRTGGAFTHFDPMILFQTYLDWLNVQPGF